MPYHLLWKMWSTLLVTVAVVVGMGSLGVLIYLVVSEPTRADAWVWGLAAATLMGDLAAAVYGLRLQRGLRLTAVGWLVQVAAAVLLVCSSSHTQGLVVLGYVFAASAMLNLPYALGLWPGPIEADSSPQQQPHPTPEHR